MTTFLNNDGNIANALEVQNDNLEKVMGDGVQYMSSREIAELCEKQHKNVIRDIRRMLEDLGLEATGSNLSRLKNSENLTDPNLDSLNNFKILSYKDAKGEMRTEYLLDKNLSLTLVAGYNVVLRNRIINRWLELEQKEQQQQPMPNIESVLSNPNALRGILFNYVERVIALENTAKQREAYISDIEPQAEAFEKIGSSDETFTITQAAKILDLKRLFLLKFLEVSNWIYRQNGKITPMQPMLDQGLLVLKFYKNTQFSHVLLTSKGLQKITLLITKKFPSLNFKNIKGASNGL